VVAGRPVLKNLSQDRFASTIRYGNKMMFENALNISVVAGLLDEAYVAAAISDA
jgi:hypothetical protein